MTRLVVYFLLALGTSFSCSLLEAVMLSVPLAYVNALEKGNSLAGRLLKRLKSNIDRPLSAILTLNTVANTIGAAGVGAQALKLWGDKYVALVSAILTLLILVLSEVIPKTLGAFYCKSLAPAASYAIYGLIYILYPVVVVLEAILNMFSREGVRGHISREEMMATAELGLDHGTLLSQENRVIQNLLCLKNIRAKDILTPRSVLLAFQQNRTIADVVRTNTPVPFSRIPVYGKDMDDITGFVLRYKILQGFSQGHGADELRTLVVNIHAIPDTKSVAETLDEFIKRREHIFLVVDEYGGTAGIITMEDTIESLLGVEIVDEFDTIEDMRKYAITKYQRQKKDRYL
jgi:CBS domain containing-hemolysin-like protein